MGQTPQWFELTGDNVDKYAQHHQQTHTNNRHYGVAQAVEPTEDIALRTHDSHRTASFPEWLVKHIAVLAIHIHVAHALFPTLHGMTQCSHSRIGLQQRLGKNRLARNLRRVGMHKISTTTAYHNTVGVGIRLHSRDGLREPVQRETGVDDANDITLFILDGLAITGHHLVGIGRGIQVHIWLSPARVAEQCRHEIPVHKEILIVVAAALYSTDPAAIVLSVGREIATIILEIVRLEGDRTRIEIRIVTQHTLAIHKHRVGHLGVSLHQPFGHLRGHLYTIQDALYLK